MSEKVTLEQLLNVMKPSEYANINVKTDQFSSCLFFSGKIEELPENLYKKYKDFFVISMDTPYYDIGDYDEELYYSGIGLNIILEIPDTYPYYKWSFNDLLNTIDDTEKIIVLDPTDYCSGFTYEGLKKDMSNEIFNQLKNRKVIFVEKPYIANDREEPILDICLTEENNSHF